MKITQEAVTKNLNAMGFRITHLTIASDGTDIVGTRLYDKVSLCVRVSLNTNLFAIGINDFFVSSKKDYVFLRSDGEVSDDFLRMFKIYERKIRLMSH